MAVTKESFDDEFGNTVPFQGDPIPSHTGTYYATRFEWLMSGILQGLIAGTAPKDRHKCIAEAIELAIEADRQLNEHKAKS